MTKPAQPSTDRHARGAKRARMFRASLPTAEGKGESFSPARGEPHARARRAWMCRRARADNLIPREGRNDQREPPRRAERMTVLPEAPTLRRNAFDDADLGGGRHDAIEAE